MNIMNLDKDNNKTNANSYESKDFRKRCRINNSNIDKYLIETVDECKYDNGILAGRFRIDATMSAAEWDNSVNEMSDIDKQISSSIDKVNRDTITSTSSGSVASDSTEPIGESYAGPSSSSTPPFEEVINTKMTSGVPDASCSSSPKVTCVYLHNHTAIMMNMEDTGSVTANMIQQAVIGTDELGLTKGTANHVFAIWMKSPLIELQLKPDNVPYEIRKNWHNLLAQYSHTSPCRQSRDEPMVTFQRNVFYPYQHEEKIKDQRILELLFEECRYNILNGKYPCEMGHYIMLGGIQARIELGAYNSQVHSTHYFREEQAKYLPLHVRKRNKLSSFLSSSKNSPEVRLLEQFKRIPSSATNRKLMRKYLEFCWSLPFYGAAFFEGQIEQPVRGLMSFMAHQDVAVLVAINQRGVFVIDDANCTILLGLKHSDLSWEFARPSKDPTNSNCLPCLFLQFLIVENGARVSKILQIFSAQASLMDVLITGFVEKNNRKDKLSSASNVVIEVDGSNFSDDTLTIGNRSHLPSLSNKLSKLTLATFDDNGRCIGQMGSWSFNY